MNCKPGDRAVAIRGEHKGLHCDVIADGGIFTYLETGEDLRGWIVAFDGDVNWGEMSDPANASEGWYPDAWLRPVGDDETSALAGKHEQVTA